MFLGFSFHRHNAKAISKCNLIVSVSLGKILSYSQLVLLGARPIKRHTPVLMLLCFILEIGRRWKTIGRRRTTILMHAQLDVGVSAGKIFIWLIFCIFGTHRVTKWSVDKFYFGNIRFM